MSKPNQDEFDKIDFILDIVNSNPGINTQEITDRFYEKFPYLEGQIELGKLLVKTLTLDLILAEGTANFIGKVGYEVLHHGKGYNEYLNYKKSKEEKQDRHLDIQISLSSKANKFFYFTTVLGFLGFVFSTILGIIELSKSRQKEEHIRPLPEQTLHNDEKLTDPILEVDTPTHQSKIAVPCDTTEQSF